MHARFVLLIPFLVSFVVAQSQTNQAAILDNNILTDMKVALLNDGPVTIWMDSRGKE